jgi:CheY-like chemotaxis protein
MYTVLIADDEQIERSFLRGVIEGQGIAKVIAEAGNGEKLDLWLYLYSRCGDSGYQYAGD